MNKRSNYAYPDLNKSHLNCRHYTKSSHFMKLHSVHLFPVPGMVSKMAGFVIFGLSRTAAPLIVSIVVGSLNTWAIATSRSLISKVCCRLCVYFHNDAQLDKMNNCWLPVKWKQDLLHVPYVENIQKFWSSILFIIWKHRKSYFFIFWIPDNSNLYRNTPHNPFSVICRPITSAFQP